MLFSSVCSIVARVLPCGVLVAKAIGNALLKSGISQGRWEDAKAILTAKGLDITQDNIISELQTHPEWLGNAQVNDMQNQSTKPLSPQMAEQFAQGYPNPQKIEKPSVIRKVGSEVQSIPNDMSEDDQINKWFGLIKENITYLIVAILGLVLLAVGGVSFTTAIGKILFYVGIAFSILSIIMGLRNKGLEWEEFD